MCTENACPFMITCAPCHGAGGWDIGDCEDGVWESCEWCDGSGEVED